MAEEETVDELAWLRWCSELLPGAVWRQRLLAKVLGTRPWQVDLHKGTATFGDDLTFSLQLLGSETDDGTWLWAWANEASQLPAPVVRAVKQVRDTGIHQQVSEMTTPMLPVADSQAFHLALIAASIAGKLPVYRGPYPGGAAYFALEGVPLPEMVPDIPETVSCLRELVSSQWPLHHQLAVWSFAHSSGLHYSGDKINNVLACQSGEVFVTFDEHGSLTKIESKHEAKLASKTLNGFVEKARSTQEPSTKSSRSDLPFPRDSTSD